MFTLKIFGRITLVATIALLMLAGNIPTPVAAVVRDSVWYLPMAFNNNSGWYSMIFAQNTSNNTESISFQGSISVLTGGDRPCAASQDGVPPGGIVILYPTENCTSIFGATVWGFISGTTTPSSIVAYIENYRQNGSTGTDSTQEYYGVPASAATNAVYVPGIKKVLGWTTSLAIQNVGTAETTITVSYYGFTCTDTSPLITPKSTWVFSPCIPPASTTAALVNGNGQPIAVVVSQTGTTYQGQAGAFSMAGGFGFTSATVQNLANQWNGLSTAIGCVNSGTVPTNITVTYNNGNSDSVSNVMPGQFASINQNGSNALPSGTLSVTPTLSSSGQPINCYVSGFNGRTDDNYWAYTANNHAYSQSPSQGSPTGNTTSYGLVHANWYYNWATSTGASTSMEFVPMEWSDWECRWYESSFWCSKPYPYQHSDPYVSPYPTPMPTPCDPSNPQYPWHCPVTSTSTWLMGFNEANACAPGMSCTGWANLSGEYAGYVTTSSPQRAAQLWKKFQDTYPLMKLLSPSTVNGNDTFLDDVRSAFYGYYNSYPRYDGFSTHCNSLWGGSGGENGCITVIGNDLTRAINWYVPEVWLTEFTVRTTNGSPPPDDPNTCSANKVATLRRFMDWLSVQHRITRYQYAQQWEGFCNVINVSNGTLTEVGKAYWLYR